MISVLICTYNRTDSLRVTLESLARMSVPLDLAWELIVVDNNSTDDTRAVVEEFARTSSLNVRYLFEGQQGKSIALNTGVRSAKGEIIAFTDDDVIVHPQWIADIKATFEKFACLGVAGRIVPVWEHGPKPSWAEMEGPYGFPRVFANFDLGEEPKLITTDPSGANMAFRKIAFEKYGLFRTDLGLVGSERTKGEETEFAFRLIKAGERLAYAPGAIVYHPVPQHKMAKSYVLSYYFDYGRTSVLMGGWPEGAICYFGVPRYMFRSLLENSIKWVTALDRRARFNYKMKLYLAAGEIVAARRLSKS